MSGRRFDVVTGTLRPPAMLVKHRFGIVRYLLGISPSTRRPENWNARRAISSSGTAITYSDDSEGRISQMLAPLPSGVSNCTTWVAGCKALQFGYDTAGHVTAVTFRTTTSTGSELRVDA
jgi:hypothetical protein